MHTPTLQQNTIPTEALALVLGIDTRQIINVDVNETDKILTIDFNPVCKYQNEDETYPIEYSFSELTEMFERSIFSLNSLHCIDITATKEKYTVTVSIKNNMPTEGTIKLKSYTSENKLDAYVNLVQWLGDTYWEYQQFFKTKPLFS